MANSKGNDEGHQAVEKALGEMISKPMSLPPAKSFAPPQSRGIHELVNELSDDIEAARKKLEIIKQTLAYIDKVQTTFFNGSKP